MPILCKICPSGCFVGLIHEKSQRNCPKCGSRLKYDVYSERNRIEFEKTNKRTHTPNFIPLGLRLVCAIASISLLVYFSYGLIADELYMPCLGKRSRCRGHYIHGIELWVTYTAVICACSAMISIIIDHFDTRNNEETYTAFASFFTMAAFFLFSIAPLTNFIYLIN